MQFVECTLFMNLKNYKWSTSTASNNKNPTLDFEHTSSVPWKAAAWRSQVRGLHRLKKWRDFPFQLSLQLFAALKNSYKVPFKDPHFLIFIISKAVLLSPFNKPSLWDNEKTRNTSSKGFDIKVVWNIHWAKLENSPNFNKVANEYHIMKVPPRGKSKKVKWMMNS